DLVSHPHVVSAGGDRSVVLLCDEHAPAEPIVAKLAAMSSDVDRGQPVLCIPLERSCSVEDQIAVGVILESLALSSVFDNHGRLGADAAVGMTRRSDRDSSRHD